MARILSGTPGIDIPIYSAWRQHDNLAQFAAILREHDQGYFMRSAMAVDELMTDDRIQGVIETRIGELLSSPFKVNPASADDKQAVDIAEKLGGTDGYTGTWEQMVSPETVSQMEKWGIFLGFAVGEIVWERTPDEYRPRLVPWHPANVWWHQFERRFILNTQQGPVTLPRPDEQPNGDGKWVVWCPYGVQYGWREGLVRSLGEIYLSRRYAKRDFNRWTETRSLGIIKGKTPEGANEDVKAQFRNDLSNLGQDGVVICPQGNTERPGYDVEGVQLDSAGSSWQGIKGLIDDTNTDIAVLILGSNQPTEIKEGSLAASQTAKKTSVNRALRDASIGPTIGRQMLTHWADANMGRPDLAPRPCYEVQPPEDDLGEAQALKALGDGLQSLALASPRVDVEAILEGEGVPLLSEQELAAKQEEEAERAAELAAAAQPEPAEQPTAADPADGAKKTADAGKKSQPARAALGGPLESVRARYQFCGLEVAVENPRNTIRQWTDSTGKAGHTVMKCDYGFLDGYCGADKEELDCYIGPNENAADVYVVRQHGPVGMGGRWCFDEDKVMLGFSSAEEAKAAFLAHRDDGERAFGGMVVYPLDKFMAKLRRRGPVATTKIAASAIDRDTTKALISLAARGRRMTALAKTVAGQKRAAKYQDLLVEEGVRRASAALAPFLRSLRAEIDGAESLAALKPKLVKAFRKSDPKTLATILRRVGVLANVSGQAGAREEVHAHG